MAWNDTYDAQYQALAARAAAYQNNPAMPGNASHQIAAIHQQMQNVVAARDAAAADIRDRQSGKGIYYVASAPNSGGGGGGPSATPAYVASPPPPPPPPAATTYSVKQPDVALVQYNPDALPQELLTDLLYEDVGGTELISIARHDTINGQDVAYSVVRNLSILNQAFNPNNILAGQAVYSAYTNQYALDIASKINENSVYLDADGNLIVELSSANVDEYLEIEMSTDGTIYRMGA